MKDPLVFVDIIAWIAFAFQALIIAVGMYDISERGKTDTYANPFIVLISLSWIIYRFIT